MKKRAIAVFKKAYYTPTLLDKIIKFQNIILIKNKMNFSYSFYFPFVLSKLEINPNDLESNLTQFSYGVLLLSVVTLYCFINILIYIIGYYLIQESQAEKYYKKYPILNKFINRYKKVSLFYFFIEILFCLTCLFLLILFSALFVYSNINKI